MMNLPSGHFLLTVLLVDRLLASAPSHVVVLSSSVHAMTTINYDSLTPAAESSRVWAAMKMYSQSKLANILFTKELARRLKG